MKKFLIMALLAAPLFANALNFDAQQGKLFRNHKRGGECCNKQESSHHHRRDRRSEQFGYFFTTSTQTIDGLPAPVGHVVFTDSGEHSRRVHLDANGNVVIERPGTYEVTFSVLATVATGTPPFLGFRIDLQVDGVSSGNIFAVPTTTQIGGELFGQAIVRTENRNAVLSLENVSSYSILLVNNVGNATLGAPHNISASITVEEIARRERRSD